MWDASQSRLTQLDVPVLLCWESEDEDQGRMKIKWIPVDPIERFLAVKKQTNCNPQHGSINVPEILQ